MKIETWKGDPKATFVIPDPAGILHVSGLVWCKRRRVTTQWVLYPLAGDDGKSYDVAQQLRKQLLKIKKRWKKSGEWDFVRDRKRELGKFGLHFPDSTAQSLPNPPIAVIPVEAL